MTDGRGIRINIAGPPSDSLVLASNSIDVIAGLLFRRRAPARLKPVARAHTPGSPYIIYLRSVHAAPRRESSASALCTKIHACDTQSRPLAGLLFAQRRNRSPMRVRDKQADDNATAFCVQIIIRHLFLERKMKIYSRDERKRHAARSRGANRQTFLLQWDRNRKRRAQRSCESHRLSALFFFQPYLVTGECFFAKLHVSKRNESGKFRAPSREVAADTSMTMTNPGW